MKVARFVLKIVALSLAAAAAVCAVIAKHGLPCPVERIGVNDEFGHSGPAGALLEQFGLCAGHIAEAAHG